ncbi:MAG: alpha/beta fold hydrolase [Flavobacteriaceae bacterium]|nr:alpha/beta fold hydrolase [Flavobacteriaceae bacterium]
MTHKVNSILVLFILALLGIGCSCSNNVEKEVLKASKSWVSNFNMGNITEISNAYAEDAIMVAKPFGFFEGKKSIREFWTPFIQSGATNLKYYNAKVAVINDTKAILSANWSMNVGNGIITNETWIKQAGEWKLQEDHFEVKEQFDENGNSVEMDKKETYVLVHAAWLGAWQWNNVAKFLKGKGHTVITPNLPGHGSDKTIPAKITMKDYVNTITNILDAQDEAVVLVGHSFNGITVSRVAELRPKKVKSLVYLTAFLLPEGGSFFGAVQGVKGSKAVENFRLSEDKTYAYVEENEIQNAFAHDIPKEAFDKAKPYIVPEPAAPLSYELETTTDIFGKIPKYYIECTEDRAIPIEVQRGMYKGKVAKVFTLNSSHTPNFSQPRKLADILLQIPK